MPQLFVLQRYREVENLTGHYVFFLGAYRGLYILNWVYRSYYEQFYRHNWLVYVSGAVQTALYVDFFYYVVSKYYGGKLTLPTWRSPAPPRVSTHNHSRTILVRGAPGRSAIDATPAPSALGVAQQNRRRTSFRAPAFARLDRTSST